MPLDESPPRRSRGRPRETVNRYPGEGVPLELGPPAYSPAARSILQAAVRVLLESTRTSFTLTGVAEQAHVDVTTIRYHFGSRAGLLEAVTGHVYAGSVAELVDAVRRQPTPLARAQTYVASVKSLFGDRHATATYFQVATMAIREPRLRERFAQLNAWRLEQFWALVHGPDEPVDRVRAELMFAALDGIELHAAIAGDDYPLDEVLALLESFVGDTPQA